MWADLREATLRVDSQGDGARLVRFRAWPFWYPAAPAQTVTLALDGVRVEEIRMEAGPHVYEVWTPKDLWRRGTNEIRFTFAYAEAPRDKNPPSDDSRTLAAAFDTIEILPAKKRARPFAP